MVERNKRWLTEMLTYFCFTFLHALWPIGMMFAARAVQGYPLRIADVVADGGILTVATGLNIGAVSRLIKITKWVELRILFGGLATVTLLSGSFFYGLRYFRGATSSIVFVKLCIPVFIVSLVIATFCRFIPEDDQ